MRWLVNAEYGYGIWYDIAVIVPSVAFLTFLVLQLKSSIEKLRRSGSSSYIMASCYALLWLVSIFNLLWCLLQVWQGLPAQLTAFNVLSLVTRSGMLLLEVCVVVFLLQGNHVRGWNALLQSLILSSAIAGIDLTVKAIYIFGYGVPLFVDGNDVGDWHKWGFWLAHKLLLVAVYAFILCLPHTKWQNRLPDSFHLFTLHGYTAAESQLSQRFTTIFARSLSWNTTSALGCALLATGVGFGYWIYGFTNICYHAFYPPLLYATFLKDFFQEEDLHLEDVYYSEMKDAGFFDADWD